MISVVQANGNELANTCDRTAQAWRALDQRQIGRLEPAQFRQCGVTELVGGNVLDDAAEIAQLAFGINESRLFLAGVAITNEFHFFPLG